MKKKQHTRNKNHTHVKNLKRQLLTKDDFVESGADGESMSYYRTSVHSVTTQLL